LSKSEQIGEINNIDLNNINEKFRIVQRLFDGILETFGSEFLNYLNNTKHDIAGRHVLGTAVPHDSVVNLTDVDLVFTDNAEKVLKIKKDETGIEAETLSIPDLITGSISKLASVTVNLQNGDSKTTIYTIPTGKSCIVTYVIIHTPSGNMAGGTNFSIGSGASADSWDTGIDLSSLTGYITLTKNNENMTIEVADNIFGILPVVGAVADVTATCDLFGYLF
jgi:hypothetical protein